MEGYILSPVEQRFAKRLLAAVQLLSQMESNSFASKDLTGWGEGGNFVGGETTSPGSFQSNLWAKKDAPFDAVLMKAREQACAMMKRARGAAAVVIEFAGHEQLGGV